MDTNGTRAVSGSARSYVITRDLLYSVMALAIVIGNSLTLIAVKRSKKLRKVPTNVLIASLAASDGTIGLLIPFTVTLKLGSSTKFWTLKVCALLGPYYAAFGVSLFTLLAIAIDRFFAIVHPLAYKRRMTTKMAAVVALLIWITELGSVTAFTCYYGSRADVGTFHPSAAHTLFPSRLFVFLMQAAIVLPIGGNIVLYLCIFAKIRKRTSVGPRMANGGVEDRESVASKQNKAFTKMMALVLGYLILACMPYYIIEPIYAVSDPSRPGWFRYMFDIAILLFFSNSFMNPVIYSWKSRDFRLAYKKVLRCAPPDSDSQSSRTV